MAGTLTHYKIGLNIYNNISSIVDKDLYLTSIQGHDLLLFIKLKNIFNLKKYHELSELLQDNNFLDICLEFQKYLKNNPQDIKVKSFFYGYLTHHITDSIYHPFIHYFTHIVTDEKETKKYEGYHAMFESLIDTLYYPNIPEVIKNMPNLKKDHDLENIINTLFKKIYHNNSGKIMVKYLPNVKSFLKFYRQDKTKIKRIGYLIIQKITHKNYEFLAYNYPLSYYKITLGEEKTWHHPVTNEEFNSSLKSLEEEATNKVLELIKALENNTINKEDLDISAYHGLQCHKDYTLKYFYDL